MGTASVYLPICLMPESPGEQEGMFWGFLFIKGQENPHRFAQDMLHIHEYTHNQYARQVKEIFR